MFKIYSKKAYRFSLYDGGKRVKNCDIPRNIITGVPDWVENDPLFAMGIKSGNISIIGKAGNADLNAVDMLMNEAKNLGIQNPGTMTIDALQIAMAKAKKGGSSDDTDNTGSVKPPAKAKLVEEAVSLGIDKAKANKMKVEQLIEAINEAKARLSINTDEEEAGGSSDDTDNTRSETPK